MSVIHAQRLGLRVGLSETVHLILLSSRSHARSSASYETGVHGRQGGKQAQGNKKVRFHTGVELHPDLNLTSVLKCIVSVDTLRDDPNNWYL